MPTSISRDVLRVGWVIASVLVAVVHAVLVAAVRAVGRRCHARRRRSRRGSSLLAAVCSGSHVAAVVAGCRGRGWVPRSRCVLELRGVTAVF